MLAEYILQKKGLRSDRFWTHPLVYRSFLKLIPLFFDTWALMKSQYWSRERIERLRDQRLGQLFTYARRVTYWNALLSVVPETSSPLQMLESLPITSKRELIQSRPEDIADYAQKERSDPDHTSGSTGIPFNFFQDWHASLRSFAITERVFRSTDAPRWPIGRRAPIVYMRARERNGFTFYRHIWFFMRSYSAVQNRMDDIASLGKKLKRGFILYGYTSWVVELVRQMEKRNMSLPFRSLMVAGEHLTEHDREYIERTTGVELYTLYASRETGFLGYECKLHSMHISEEWAYLEIVDEAGRVLPDGSEGRILVTTFDNEIMPFIRYEIGDVGIISSEPCACGRTLKTLTFKGRTSELIELDDNRTVSLLDVAYSMGHVKDAVRQYQLIQTSSSTFTIKVVAGPLFKKKRDDLEQILVRLMHPNIRISWEVVDDIPAAKSGKAQYYIRDFTSGS